MNTPEGYEVPVHVALTQPVLLAGVPRTFAIVVVTVGAAVAIGLQVPWVGIPLAMLLHSVGYALTRRDARFFDALRRHLRHKAYLDA